MLEVHGIMFGRLFYLAMRKEINLNTAFHSPILLEPPYFAHTDGSLRESKKDISASLDENKY